MEIRFRQAQPEDADRACPLIYSAAPEAFDYMFAAEGYSALEYLRYAFVGGGGLLGYRIHVVASVKDAVVGTIAFYSKRGYFCLGLGNAMQVLRFFGLKKGWSVLKKCSRVQKIIPPPRPGMAYIADLGVVESLRGKGVGSALLQHGLRAARDGGKRLYGLDVAANNPRAQQLYERLGMTVMSERRLQDAGGNATLPAIRRMEMPL